MTLDELTPQERIDLINALSDAAADLAERAYSKYSDYEPEDMPEIEAQILRWHRLARRLSTEPSPTHPARLLRDT